MEEDVIRSKIHVCIVVAVIDIPNYYLPFLFILRSVIDLCLCI